MVEPSVAMEQQAMPHGQCGRYMTRNTHTPSHPSADDEASMLY